ncbi:MAG: hypothetical protein CVT86_04190, partial [Alphaproteobacteria bacterium HGW-Alphaproteobacteria-8]
MPERSPATRTLADRLSLRLRVFLFFALIAVAVVALMTGAMAMLGQRGAAVRDLALFGGGAGFALVGVVVWVWLKFDENLVRPVERIARDARAAAHAEAETLDAAG